MKKIVLTVFFVLTLALGYRWMAESENSEFLPQDKVRSSESGSDNFQNSIRAPGSQNNPLVAEEQPAEEDALNFVSAVPVMPSVYFPHAPVISSLTLEGKKAGESRLLKVVETNMSQPYVLIEETYKSNGAGNQLIDQAAMVANQILLNRPSSVDEGTFRRVLSQAGATEVKKTGESFLATFPARPEDPMALNKFIAKVREIAGIDLTIEPNYLRKII